jgi:hypothetical protein
MSFGQRYSRAITQLDAARLPFLMIQDGPQVAIIVNGAWYFRGSASRISYHVHHIHGDISEQLTGVCFASARRRTLPSVANRLSNSLTPRAPCRWRAVVGGVDQRSTAGASPNHRRLPLGFGHLPSPFIPEPNLPNDATRRGDDDELPSCSVALRQPIVRDGDTLKAHASRHLRH